MFLTSCAYMLRPLIAVLRKHGIPFHNPYRRSNGFWNPLRIGKRASTAGRILSLLVAHPDFGEGHRPWTNGDVALWAEVLQAKGILRHGMKAKLKAADAAQARHARASRRDLRAGRARIADGCVGRRLPRPPRMVAGRA